MKKTLALIIALAMMLSLGITASAAERKEINIQVLDVGRSVRDALRSIYDYINTVPVRQFRDLFDRLLGG